MTDSEVALEFVSWINHRDLDGLAELMTDDHTFIDYEGNVERGRELMRQGWAGYFEGWPEYRIEVHHVLTGGDGVAILGKTTGSHVAPEVEEREYVLWTAEVLDGKVAEWRIYATSDQAIDAFEAYR